LAEAGWGAPVQGPGSHSRLSGERPELAVLWQGGSQPAPTVCPAWRGVFVCVSVHVHAYVCLCIYLQLSVCAYVCRTLCL
jgi:hypothetical protein